MNRFNFGNQVTNGMQVLNVGATAGSGKLLGRADTALNNLSKGEREEYSNMKLDKQTQSMRKELDDYKNPKMKQGDDGVELNTHTDVYELEIDSEQGEPIKRVTKKNYQWLTNWTNKSTPIELKSINTVDYHKQNKKEGD